MPTIKRILCPIDFSPVSRDALGHAVAMGRCYRARVTALHVAEIVAVPDGLVAAPGTVFAPSFSVEEAASEAARFVEPMRSAGVQVDVAVVEGSPTRTILEIAARENIDLVVMGTHGRSGLKHLLLGSVAERVLRRATRPVLVVPPAAQHAARTIDFAHILCPVDFGPSSLKALDYAASLAREANGVLTVLHVLEPIRDDGMVPGFDPAQFHTTILREARQRLREAVSGQARAGCRPIDLLTSGPPEKEILRVARDIGAQLIVMGVAGRGAVDRMIFGSTTTHVVRNAPCPVLTLREQAAAHAIEDSQAVAVVQGA